MPWFWYSPNQRHVEEVEAARAHSCNTAMPGSRACARGTLTANAPRQQFQVSRRNEVGVKRKDSTVFERLLCYTRIETSEPYLDRVTKVVGMYIGGKRLPNGSCGCSQMQGGQAAPRGWTGSFGLRRAERSP